MAKILDSLEEKLSVGSNIPDKIMKVTDDVSYTLSGANYTYKKLLVDNVISLVGLSGGAGASTIVANLAYLLNKSGLSVLMIDTNLMYPTLYSFFDIPEKLDRNDLYSFLMGNCSLGESIVYPKKDLGLLCTNNRNFVNYLDADNKTSATNFIEALDRASNLFDVVLIDGSLKIDHDIVNAAMYKSDSLYFVMDESLSCLSNYDRFVNALQNSGINFGSDSGNERAKVPVIMNKRTSVQYSNVFDTFGMELVKVIPFDTALIKSGLMGDVFCNKGSSTSKNATLAYERLKGLMADILKRGGYTGKDRLVEIELIEKGGVING